MASCYMCGISDEKALLYEGIHKLGGIVSVCRKCYFKNKMPIIEKKEVDFSEFDKPSTFKERLAQSSIVKQEIVSKEVKIAPEDEHLKEMVRDNFRKNLNEGYTSVDDVVDKFEWVIKRRRRQMRLTQKEFAEKIHEELIVVDSLEKGYLPRDYYSLIKKVQTFLGLRLLKSGKIRHEDIVQESRLPSGILMSELMEVVDEKGKVENKKEEPVVEREIPKKIEKKKMNYDNLSEGDISDLIFRK